MPPADDADDAGPPTTPGAWQRGHPWAAVYDFIVEHERVGHGLARLGAGTDFGLLVAAAQAIGRLPDGSAVLDVPCGGGVALRGLRPEQDITYTAVDISEAMLARTRRSAARRGLRQVATVAADVGDLPFADAAYDLAVSFTGLHCFPDPRRAILELGRCVRPGGALTGSSLLSDNGLRYAPMRVGGRAMGLLGPGLSEAGLRRGLAEAGFGSVGVSRSGALSYFDARREAAARPREDQGRGAP